MQDRAVPFDSRRFATVDRPRHVRVQEGGALDTLRERLEDGLNGAVADGAEGKIAVVLPLGRHVSRRRHLQSIDDVEEGVLQQLGRHSVSAQAAEGAA